MNLVPEPIQEMYPDMEAVLMPQIQARVASKLKHGLDGMDVDDAIQEARLMILLSMRRYDFNKGDLASYMSRVVTNTCNALYHKTTQWRRMPRVEVRDEQTGEIKAVPTRPGSYDQRAEAGDEAPADFPSPDARLDWQESVDQASELEHAIFQALDEREAQVLRCRLHPPPELRKIVGEGDPSNVHIAEYLGISKSQIDWALYKIRNVFTEVADQDRFSDVFAELIESSRWPTIHISNGADFHNEFVQRKLRQHRLQTDAPLSHRDEECKLGRRRVVQYDWGAEVAVWLGESCWTAVIRGRFNPRSGEVTGQSGARKLIPIPGYPQLAKALADERRHAMSSDHLKLLPSCLGEYEAGDDVCDGADGPPCIHRDNCVAMQLRMEEQGKTIDSYTHAREDANGEAYRVPRNIEKLAKIIAVTKKRYRIKDGAPTRTPKASPAPGKKSAEKHKEVAKKSKEPVRHRSESAIDLDSWYERWLKIICEQTGRELAEGDPEPGQLFTKDRRLKSGYIGLYCKPESGRPVGIGLLVWKPRTGTMDMKYALAPGDFTGVSKADMKKLKPQDHNDGVFIAISKGLDEAGVALGAEALAKLINDGTIQLPEAP